MKSQVKHKCLLILVAVVCASVIPAALAEGVEYGIRMNCADAATIVQDIRVIGGVMTEKAAVSAPVAVLSIPITRNEQDYSDCLDMYSENPQIAKMAFFKEMDQCRRQAASKSRLSISSRRRAALASSFDVEEYERCLREQDRELEVELIRDQVPLK